MRGPAWIAAVLVVLAVAAAIVLLLTSGDDVRPVAILGPEPEAAARKEPARADTAETRRAARRMASTAFADAAPSTYTPEEDLRVFVIDGKTGAPLPGAHVVAMEGVAADDPRIATELKPLLTEFDHAPIQTITDDDGIATVPSGDGLVVAAKRDGMFGSARFPTAPHREIRLPLWSGGEVAVRVVTPAGDPVPGVPVVLRLTRKLPNRGASIGKDAKRVTRSPDGIAVMDHRPLDAADGETFSAWIDGFEAFPQEAALRDLRDGPLALTLPPVGQLRLLLVGPDQAPFRGTAEIYLGIRPGAGAPLIPKPAIRTETADAELTLPFAPIGLPLRVVALSDDFEPAFQDVDALDAPGATRSVVLRFARKRGILVGRLVDANGAPMLGQAFEATLGTAGAIYATDRKVRESLRTARTKTVLASTDAGGTFRLAAPDPEALADGSVDVDFVIEPVPGQPALGGQASAIPVTPGGETRLGDVRLGATEVLVAGVVVDDLGTPVAGAKVTVSNKRTAQKPGAAMISARGMPPEFIQITARTSASGAFVLSTPIAFQRTGTKFEAVVLSATAAGYASSGGVGELAPGTLDARIEMRALGAIDGTISNSGGVLFPFIEMAVARPGAMVLRFVDCVDSDGYFKLDGIPPGTVDLVIKARGVLQPLATVRNVVVPRLGPASDARLKSLDVR